MDNKFRYKIVLDDLWVEGVVIYVLETQVQPLRVASAQERKSLVVVGGLFDNLIISLVWESLLTKVPEEPETDSRNYNKAIQNKDATLWQKVMKIEMESMYSKSSLIFCESTWWGKIHRLQVDL